MKTLYGISNCDTVRKARKWLKNHDISYQFHDYRQDGLSHELLENWSTEVGWETLLNRRSTSWRQVSDQDKTSIDQAKALQLMLHQPTLIKRPVLVMPDKILVGFNEKTYESIS